jgi:hypothetical protein
LELLLNLIIFLFNEEILIPGTNEIKYGKNKLNTPNIIKLGKVIVINAK